MHQSGDYLYLKQGLTGLLAALGKPAVLALAFLTAPLVAVDTAAAPRFGLTPFPYDLTVEALTNTQTIVETSGDMYALHFDDCIPWQELLDDDPFPDFFQEEWDSLKAAIPADHAVYLGIAPLAKDRRTLAPSCGPSRGDTAQFPEELGNRQLDNPNLMAAYLRLVQRAVAHFEPDFLNVGIEVDGLAAHAPDDWARFEVLFDHVSPAIRQAFPEVLIGVSMNPQMLMEQGVGERAKALVERSDYLGLSFYPYSSPMHERYGAAPLGQGDERWNRVFDWATQYTDKPVALCETGFITEEVYVEEYDLRMQGDTTSQADYVRALVNRARADNYLFVVWFLAVDYDLMYEKMPEGPFKDVKLLWRDAGLIEGDLEPKPAYTEWLRALDSDPENVGYTIGPDGRKVYLVTPPEQTPDEQEPTAQ